MKRIFNSICIASLLCLSTFGIQAQTSGSLSKIKSECNADSVFQLLQSFELAKSGSTIKINWQTSEDMNLSHFEIQRSTDGANFEVIALMFTQENAENGAAYRYADYNMPAQNSGFIYYRLKIVDMNGKSIFSALKKIEKTDMAINK